MLTPLMAIQDRVSTVLGDGAPLVVMYRDRLMRPIPGPATGTKWLGWGPPSSAVVVHPSQARAAGAGLDGNAWVADLRSGACTVSETQHSGSAAAVAWIDGFGCIATGGADGQVKVWDDRSLACLYTEAMGSAVVALAFQRGTGSLFVVLADGRVRDLRIARDAKVQ